MVGGLWSLASSLPNHPTSRMVRKQPREPISSVEDERRLLAMPPCHASRLHRAPWPRRYPYPPPPSRRDSSNERGGSDPMRFKVVRCPPYPTSANLRLPAPIKCASTACATVRPSAIAQTTKLCPRA